MSAENAYQWLQKHPAVVPALAHNHDEIIRLLELEHQSQNMVNIACSDPGLCLTILSRGNNNRGPQTSRELIESPRTAIAILGNVEFHRLLEKFPVAENVIKNPDQLFLFRQLVNRSLHHAAQAEAWAAKIGFNNLELIRVSASLSYCGELLCCLFDFRTYRQYIQSGSKEQSGKSLFGFSFADITEALVTSSNLPALIVQSLEPGKSNTPIANLLHFTARLCHQCESGWYNSDMDQLFEQFAEYLQLPLDSVCSISHQICIEAARQSPVTDAWQPAARLILQQDSAWSDLKALPRSHSHSQSRQRKPALTSTPEPAPDAKAGTSIEHALDSLNQLLHEPATTKSKLLTVSLKSLFQGLNMSRTSMFLLTADKQFLNNRMSLGVPADSPFHQCRIKVEGSGLFKMLLKKPQAIWVNSSNIQKYQSLIPQSLSENLSTDTFLAMSLFIAEKPMGIVYSDRCDSTVDIEAEHFLDFKKLISFTSKALTLLSER
jgi:hypothetical protein